jgi:hypothetical protein
MAQFRFRARRTESQLSFRPSIFSLIAFFFLLQTSHSSAKEVVHILFSISSDDNSELARVIQNFLDEFNFDFVVHPQAGPYELFQAVNSPNSIAVFWISHGCKNSDFAIASVGGEIVDFKNRDVAPIFSASHPRLTFLGIISCHAKGTTYPVTDRLLDKNPSLKVYSPEGVITPLDGVREAAQAAQLRLRSRLTTKASESKDTFKVLRIQRTLPENAKESEIVEVLVRDSTQRVFAVFPLGLPGEVQVQWATLNPKKAEIPKTLIVDSGIKQFENTPVLGEFRFSIVGDDFQWNPVTGTRGKPLGKTRHLYETKNE